MTIRRSTRKTTKITMSTTMTDPSGRRAGRPAARTPARSNMAWKNGLLAAGLGSVLLGLGLLAGDGSPSPDPAPPPTQPQVIVVQVPVQPQAPAVGETMLASQSLIQTQTDGIRSATSTTIDIPPLPEKPVFQQPITRSRGS